MKKHLLLASACAVFSVAAVAQPTESTPEIQEEVPEAATEAAVEAADQAMPEPVAEPAPPPPPPPPPPPRTLTLPADAEIKLSVTDEITSSSHEAGDTFELTVLEDVVVEDVVVIPQGAPATAEITWRTGKGAFGKSGKLEFTMRSIALEDGIVPVGGDYRQEGEGNTVATGVGIVAVGVFAAFITGKRARLPAGRELAAMPLVDVPFSSAGGFADDFDGQAVLDESIAATPLGQCKAEASTIEKEKKREKAIKKCYKKRAESQPKPTQSF
ncbi:MAG: hypothetical protein AAFR64_01360 [Pseudomonadota bacterium]